MSERYLETEIRISDDGWKYLGLFPAYEVRDWHNGVMCSLFVGEYGVFVKTYYRGKGRLEKKMQGRFPMVLGNACGCAQ